MKNMELCVEEAAVARRLWIINASIHFKSTNSIRTKMVNVLNELLIAHEKILTTICR